MYMGFLGFYDFDLGGGGPTLDILWGCGDGAVMEIIIFLSGW